MKTNFNNYLLLVLFMVLLVTLTGVMQAKEFDLEGETITIVNPGNLSNKFKDTDKGDGEYASWTAHVEETFNCKIKFEQEPPGQITEKIINGVMAGDLKYHIFNVSSRWLDQLAVNGAIYPLNDVLTEDYYKSLAPTHQDYIKQYASFNGKIWGFSTNDNPDPNIDGLGMYGIMWNVDLFEKLSLPNLYDLQNTGEWTWSKFREIAKKATADTDNDGEIDRWGVNYMIQGLQPLYFGYINGGSLYKEEDGEMVFSFNEKPALEAIRLWQKMKTVDKSVFASTNGGEMMRHFTKGKTAMHFGPVSHMYRFVWWDMKDHYGLVQLPKGPNQKDYKAPAYQVFMGYLPATVERPRALVEVGSALFRATDEYRDMNKYMDELYEGMGELIQDYESFNTLRKMYKNAIVVPPPNRSPIRGLGSTSLMGNINAAVNGESDPAAAMDSVAPEAQSVLDDTLNK